MATEVRGRVSPISSRLVAKPPRSLEERGRILYAEDIRELYGTRRNGKPRKSLKWIWAHFAPEHRHKDGKTPFWFQADVERWFDEQREGVA
jgi:hypothetical protein